MHVVVLGSANMDLVLPVDRIPGPGETVLAAQLSRTPGGKGANQAVAAARAGARTAFVGAVGDDGDGQSLRSVLVDAGIDTSALQVLPGPSGTAVVVDPAGENAIVVAPGANASLVHLTERARELIALGDVLLAQLEIPVTVVTEAARHASASGTRVVVNAAPTRALPDELWAALDLLVVNQHEARALAGADDLDTVVASLLERAPEVVVTLGAEGALHCTRDAPPVRVPGAAARAVDTTGAGDTFCGVLVAGLAGGLATPEAIARANAAAAVSVESLGAIPSIPDAAAIATRHRQWIGRRSP